MVSPAVTNQNGASYSEDVIIYKRQEQLEKQIVDWSYELSIVRIHVEHVFGLLKQKYTILLSVLLICMIASNDDNADECTVDKIVPYNTNFGGRKPW